MCWMCRKYLSNEWQRQHLPLRDWINGGSKRSPMPFSSTLKTMSWRLWNSFSYTSTANWRDTLYQSGCFSERTEGFLQLILWNQRGLGRPVKRLELNRAGSFRDSMVGWAVEKDFPGRVWRRRWLGGRQAECKGVVLCRRPLWEHWERKGCLVEESQLGEESRMRRFLLLGRYLGTTAGYLGNKVVGQSSSLEETS